MRLERATILRVGSVAAGMALALALAAPAAACAPEDPPPAADGLVKSATLIVVGRGHDAPEGQPVGSLSVLEVLLGPSMSDVDLQFADEDCSLASFGPGPGATALWVFTDLATMGTWNTGFWPVDASGNLLDGWPDDRPLGATSVAGLQRLLAAPATDAGPVPAARPSSPVPWPLPVILAPAVGLVLAALRRRLATSR